MKKALILTMLIFLVFSKGNAQDTINVILRSPFRLNPITGINGDQFEANSKFVQRMIFSPLVFPLQNPYLRDDFDVAMDLSMIENRIQYFCETRREFTDFHVDSNNSEVGGQARRFRVRLRDNLEFSPVRNRRWEITPHDVVFSYRLARITMDRIFHARAGTQQINTLLYARIRSIENIYFDANSGYIVFEVERAITSQAFINLLVYAPIFSIRQMIQIDPRQDNEITRSLSRSLRFSQLPGEINDSRYDNYDFNFLLRPGNRSLVRDFFNNPMGYGQFVVQRTRTYGGRDVIHDLFGNVTLTRNPNWGNFSDSPYKTINNIRVRHRDFANNRLRINVSVTGAGAIDGHRILNMRETEVLYNVPLATSLFDTLRQLHDTSAIRARRKMQIPHSLYGIFFGPSRDGRNHLSFSTRRFFEEITDRTRIENTLRHTTGDPDFMQFLVSMLGSDHIASDINLQRLYLPFYVGSRGSPIGQLHAVLEEHDDFYQYFRDVLYFAGAADFRDLFAIKYAQGGIPSAWDISDYFIHSGRFSEEKETELTRLFNAARNEFMHNGTVNIRIAHRRGDKIGQTIAFSLRNTLQWFFSGVSEKERGTPNQWVFSSDNVRVEEISSYSGWRAFAERNARDGRICLLIKGWNFRFDIRDLLQYTFISSTVIEEIQNLYDQFIFSDRNHDVIYAEIANAFVSNHAIVPVIGVHNYAVFTRGNFPAFESEQFRDIEILLLPFYWRQ